MGSVRTYTIIYVVLLVLGTAKFVFFEVDQLEQIALPATVLLAVIKGLLIAAYYQHLIEEPRAISYMMGIALFMVLLLTIAAGFSIQ